MNTFGSTEENTQSVDVVDLCDSAEHGDDVQLSAFVVPCCKFNVLRGS